MPGSPKPHEKWRTKQRRFAVQTAKRRLKDARDCWTQLGQVEGGTQRQSELVREIVDTRGRELRGAFPDIVAVGYGRGLRKGREKPSPCVVFLVRLKRQRVADTRRLPASLFTYATLGGRRVLCAVPTDVEEQRAHLSLVAQSSERLDVSSGGIGPIEGMLASPMQIRFANNTVDPQFYALSCLHVLGMVQEFFPSLGPNCDFRPRGADRQDRVGRLSGFRGVVVAANAHEGNESFDAALGRVEATSAARAALRRVLMASWPTRTVPSHADVPDDAFIIAKDGTRLPARKILTFPDDETLLGYHTPHGVVAVRHKGLIQWKAETVGGDSGSPVISAADPGLLLGMHIAGDEEENIAAMIPAYELLNPVRFGLSPRAKLFIPAVIPP